MTKAKYTRADAVQVIDRFQTVTYEHFEAHSYASGALGSMLADALVILPEYERELLLSTLGALTAKYDEMSK